MKDITCRFILHNETRLPGRSRFYGMAKVLEFVWAVVKP